MSQHPYQAAPDRAFWLRSVANSFDPATLTDKPPFELDRTDRFMSAGSCFAANVRGYVEHAGFDYVVTERAHPAFAPGKPDMYYDAFSARYGNIYTARQMTQLLERSIGLFAPQEDHWVVGEHWIDPSDPGCGTRQARSASSVFSQSNISTRSEQPSNRRPFWSLRSV